MAVSVGLALLLQLVTLPVSAFRQHDQRVVARIAALVGHQEIEQLAQIETILGDAAADRAHIGGVERRVAGVTAENAENADALVRADGGALPLDRVHGAADGGRETDAVFGVAHVVVHRLGDGDHVHAELI